MVIRPRQFKLHCAAFIAALWVLAASAESAPEIVTVEHGGFSVVHLSSLPQPAVDEIARRTDRALENVSGWLEQSDVYTGPSYEGAIRVLIDPDEHNPSQFKTTIAIPEARVRHAFEEGRLDVGDFGVVHEVTHVLAASAYRKDGNRFYDDGLAVYLQQEFGPPGNYPVLGPDLHRAVAEVSEQLGYLIPLAEADQARRESGDRRRLGYLELGSFTQFLVDAYGINAYLNIYGGAPVQEVTGHTMADLETDWRELIKSL